MVLIDIGITYILLPNAKPIVPLFDNRRPKILFGKDEDGVRFSRRVPLDVAFVIANTVPYAPLNQENSNVQLIDCFYLRMLRSLPVYPRRQPVSTPNQMGPNLIQSPKQTLATTNNPDTNIHHHQIMRWMSQSSLLRSLTFSTNSNSYLFILPSIKQMSDG
ncbi:hypothetical protein SAMD00019534_039310 [Acytostelium subglobosum LB1]|uniref:hypothetical protein n=1 Tax=Acytostelium subglobosum LB1 TaxID=1410327 RepID=UPI00064482DC|nr:hypothetical protein SAMD00019534_039310 [Acytostelium subglobosum LB1]GAM20756.1 hypothetical protein SAMD00019534_039310 [Acytostelium subglobosum LB1]|eukprot:XP_012755890.1 hypothetical protein SAMD00019534_039310 [Acytostelium subglobosum LB1]